MDIYDIQYHHDFQQHTVRAIVAEDFEAISGHEDPMQALPGSIYKAIRMEVLEIVKANEHNVNIVLLGGVQINTPLEMEDYFQLLNFEVIKAGTDELVDLLS